MARILLVTDSAADIPNALREELNIRVLPFPIAMEGREYMDGEDFTPEEFYDILLRTPQIPTHAQLTPFLFTELFQQAWQEGYTDLIYTAINSNGSATYQNALAAREAFYKKHPQAKEPFSIRIIDSHCYTMGYGYAVIEGARQAAAGASAAEVADLIQHWIDHVRILFTPFDLKFAKKSGRVSAAAAFMGEALGIKPIMTFQDGASKVLAKIRGEKNVVPSMLELCKKTRSEGTPYLIIRAGNPEQSDLLAQACRDALGQEPALEFYIGGVIAINVGPNLAGLIYQER